MRNVDDVMGMFITAWFTLSVALLLIAILH